MKTIVITTYIICGIISLYKKQDYLTYLNILALCLLPGIMLERGMTFYSIFWYFVLFKMVEIDFKHNILKEQKNLWMRCTNQN
jgi:hypothetical protein